jgi:copper resistance protein C
MRAILAAVCLMLLAAGVVSAHASLVLSEPPDGGSIVTPATLTASFDEELDTGRSRIVVRDEAGEEVARGGVGSDPLVMTVSLPALPPGTYVARWTAVTPNDQGVTRGTIRFTVEAPAPSPTPTLTAAAATPAPTATASRAPAATPSPAPQAPATAPAASPSPAPAEPAQETGTSDLLVALVLAGILLGGLALYLFRR